MAKLFKIILLVFSLLLLSCSYNNRPVLETAPSYQSVQARISLINKQLYTLGVRVIKYNDSLAIMLPERVLFNPGSANLQYSAYHALDLVLELLAYYEKAEISVLDYSATISRNDVAKALAAAKAHKVMQYLWAQGIDASFMYADSENVALFSRNINHLNNYVVINLRILDFPK